jgi:hypothetical protein
MIIQVHPRDVKPGDMTVLFGSSDFREVAEISDMGREYWIDWKDGGRNSVIGMLRVDKGSYICSFCGAEEEDHYNNATSSVMWETQVCFTCYFWKPYVARVHHPCSVRIKGEHYWIHRDEPGAAFQGHGGRRRMIEFFDGTFVETRNLWGQGPIDPPFLDLLPDNARFCKHPKEDNR